MWKLHRILLSHVYKPKHSPPSHNPPPITLKYLESSKWNSEMLNICCLRTKQVKTQEVKAQKWKQNKWKHKKCFHYCSFCHIPCKPKESYTLASPLTITENNYTGWQFSYSSLTPVHILRIINTVEVLSNHTQVQAIPLLFQKPTSSVTLGWE